MASGTLLAQFQASDLYRESSNGYNYQNTSALFSTANGGSRGIRLNKFVIASQLYEYYNAVYYVPSTVALATGLTWKFILVDDGTNSADPGLVVRLEVTPFNLSASGALVDFSVAGSKGTVTTANVTLNSTSGVPTIGSVPIVVANLASLASGSILGFRLRRVGDNAADTCNSSVICLGGIIYDT